MKQRSRGTSVVIYAGALLLAIFWFGTVSGMSIGVEPG